MPIPEKSEGSVSARFSVWFSRRSAAANDGEVGPERLEAAAVERAERRLAAHEVQRRAPLRAGLGEDERAGREVEGGEPHLARELRPGRLPVEPARDHEVQRQEQLAVEREHDPLPQPADRGDAPPLHLREGRIGRAEQERTPQPDALEGLAQHPRGQGLDVHLDVGELGHLVILVAGRAAGPASRRGAC